MGLKDFEQFAPEQLKIELQTTSDQTTRDYIRQLLRSRAVSDLGGKLARVMDRPSLAAAFTIPELDTLLSYVTDDSVSDEIVRTMRIRRMELVKRLIEHPEEVTRRLGDAEIENLLPYVTDANTVRVLAAILSEHAGRQEDWLTRSGSAPGAS
jgi:hypothetical protein